MNKRKDDAEEILAVLNLRCMEKDRKVKEFVKKYRGSLNK
jgi:ribosomal protein L30/L7E